MTKVFLFMHDHEKVSVDGVTFMSIDSASFSINDRPSIIKLLRGGYDEYSFARSLTHARYVNEMYLGRDPSYMKLVDKTLEIARECDVLVMGKFNYLHPEILKTSLPDCKKILGFIDDPFSTYSRGIPYLHAFDGCFYISPGYINNKSFSENLAAWGCKNSIWMPMSQIFTRPDNNTILNSQRENSLMYVGNPTLSKVNRLAHLKRLYQEQIKIHGRWRFKGLEALFSPEHYLMRVSSLTAAEKIELMLTTKLGINMHVSDDARETGNMRMYEYAAYGVVQFCDRANLNMQEEIFKENDEIIIYDSQTELRDKIEHYLSPDQSGELGRIRENALKKYEKNYDYSHNIKRLIEWAETL